MTQGIFEPLSGLGGRVMSPVAVGRTVGARLAALSRADEPSGRIGHTLASGLVDEILAALMPNDAQAVARAKETLAALPAAAPLAGTLGGALGMGHLVALPSATELRRCLLPVCGTDTDHFVEKFSGVGERLELVTIVMATLLTLEGLGEGGIRLLARRRMRHRLQPIVFALTPASLHGELTAILQKIGYVAGVPGDAAASQTTVTMASRSALCRALRRERVAMPLAKLLARLAERTLSLDQLVGDVSQAIDDYTEESISVPSVAAGVAAGGETYLRALLPGDPRLLAEATAIWRARNNPPAPVKPEAGGARGRQVLPSAPFDLGEVQPAQALMALYANLAPGDAPRLSLDEARALLARDLSIVNIHGVDIGLNFSALPLDTAAYNARIGDKSTAEECIARLRDHPEKPGLLASEEVKAQPGVFARNWDRPTDGGVEELTLMLLESRRSDGSAGHFLRARLRDRESWEERGRTIAEEKENECGRLEAREGVDPAELERARSAARYFRRSADQSAARLPSDRADLVARIAVADGGEGAIWERLRQLTDLEGRAPEAVGPEPYGGREPDAPGALDMALALADEPVAEFLLSRGADPNGMFRGTTRLYEMLSAGDEDMVRLLLHYGADPNVPNDFSEREAEDNYYFCNLSPGEKFSDGRTPLQLAALRGEFEVLERLIAAGGDVDAAAARKRTPLMDAVFFEEHDAVDALLNRGADAARISTEFFGLRKSALGIAVGRGNERLVRRLLRAGAPVDNDVDDYGSLLGSAAGCGSPYIVEALWHAGAGPQLERKHLGCTPLMEAVTSGNLRAARFLKDRGADLHTTDDEGRSPLQALRRRIGEYQCYQSKEPTQYGETLAKLRAMCDVVQMWH